MLSPRSANYERLEGGHGPSRQGVLGRFGWKKFALVAVVFIGVVYFFGLRKEDIIPSKYIPCASFASVFIKSTSVVLMVWIST